MEAVIKRCLGCADNQGPGAKYQNQKYGFGLRVHTPSQKKDQGPRCTVCGKK